MAARARHYRHYEVALLRATTHRAGDTPHLWPDLPLDGEPVQAWCAWMAQAWDQGGRAREVIEMASSDLARQLQRVSHGHLPAPRQARKLLLSLVAYLLRWRERSTPYGLFAGIAPTLVAQRTTVHWSDTDSVCARPDADWLHAVIILLEAHAALLEQLPVTACNTAFIRDDNLVVPSPHGNGVAVGEFVPHEVEIRLTSAVTTAMKRAREPIVFADLVDVLTAHRPAHLRPQACALVAGLIAQGALLTILRPPMTATDPLGHLVTQLDAVGATHVPDIAALVEELRCIQHDLTAHNTRPTRAGRAAADGRMRALNVDVPHALALDVRLGAEVTIPPAVAESAEDAADTLMKLTPAPFGTLAWKRWHHRVLDRYGVGAVIPVRDLVQSDAGIGLPAGFRGSPLRTGTPWFTKRDATILDLVQRAALQDGGEIQLTDALLSRLAAEDFDRAALPSRIELGFRLHASSPAAVDRGRFDLVVTGVPSSSASLAGRFLHLLDAPDHDEMARTYLDAPTERSPAVVAQVSAPSRRRLSDNVGRTARVFKSLISLDEYRADAETLTVDDLAVHIEPARLSLVLRSTGEAVEPAVLHALEARNVTSPIARFLSEVSSARTAFYGAFDWGAASRLTYLPQVRRGRAVLSCARWLLNTSDVSGSTWERQFAAWRAKVRIPNRVALCESDYRLPLDLDDPLHQALLHSALHRAGQVELRETATESDLAWCGRAHDILMSFHRATPPTDHRVHTAQAAPAHRPGASRWLHAHVYLRPERYDAVLTRHLPRLLDADERVPHWFFDRYRNLVLPERDPHLGLYVPLERPEDFGAAAKRLAQWAADMTERGLLQHHSLEAYHPDTGRWGHGLALVAAEHLFATDSQAALAQLTLVERTSTAPEVVAAASLVDIASAYTGSLAAGMTWLLRLPHQPSASGVQTRDHVLELADPTSDFRALRILPGGDEVADRWAQRRHALLSYHDHLAGQRDPLSVLRSLLHKHYVRMLGAGPDHERAVLHLARAAAQLWAARPVTAKEE
ncbi:lantibiotic dehydratase [Streptomyces endophyticus]|uniref:Lantibiotic dehydratase n=1 Tax=Streptomyces endophyticus TaxID=714166 RepID=A0ABU6F6Y0_9ACTN|nr:lantibiotic dehydratase [Streptomyces endophyticus]MEB8339772.1 lantibiotic dehydratase [Streptomyces endophyticus]